MVRIFLFVTREREREIMRRLKIRSRRRLSTFIDEDVERGAEEDNGGDAFENIASETEKTVNPVLGGREIDRLTKGERSRRV